MVFELMPTCKRVLFGHVMELFGLVVLFDPTIAWDTAKLFVTSYMG